MALFELTDLAAYLQQDIDTASATIARTMATGVITGYTNQLIESATYTHLLPINADRTLRLPQRPVTAVTSVTVDGSALTVDTDWDWNGYGDLIVLDGWSPSNEDEWQATVVYTAGHATVPDDITAVALSVAGRLFNATPGLVSEAIDDYRAQYAAGAAVGLLDHEKQILRKYKQRLGSIVPVAAKPGRG
jgi:hypothetical protein